MWDKKKKNGAVKRSFFCQPTTNFGHPALIRAITDNLMAAHDHLITVNIFQSIHVNTSNSPDKLSGFDEGDLVFLNVHRATLPMVLLESDSVQRRRNLQRKENRAKKRNSMCSDWDASKSILSIKVAPSFWFLNINMPIFLMKPFSNCLRKTWSKFLGGPPSKCWPNSMPAFVCIAIGKSGFLKKKSQNGRWPKLFSPKVCSVKPILAEELKKSECLCSKYLTSLLRHVYVTRLVSAW